MKIETDMLACIGRTPLVRLDRFFRPCNGVSLLAKLEHLNPGGSIQDRTAMFMVEAAERNGKLRPGGSIIAATSGDAGVGLALAGAVRGYRSVFVMPEGASCEKRELLWALGAEIVGSTAGDGMEGAAAAAAALAATLPGAVLMQDLQNLDSAAGHYSSTGPEIWEQTDGQVDVVVLSAEHGEMYAGVVRFLKERAPGLYAVLVELHDDAEGEVYAREDRAEGSHFARFAATHNLDRSLVDCVKTVSHDQALSALIDLAHTEGILVGVSAGAAAYTARVFANRLVRGTWDGDQVNVVTLFPDGPDQYLAQQIRSKFHARAELQFLRQGEAG